MAPRTVVTPAGTIPVAAVTGMIQEIRDEGALRVTGDHIVADVSTLRGYDRWINTERLIACLEDHDGDWSPAIDDFLARNDVRVEGPGPSELLNSLLDSVHGQPRGVFWDRLYERLLQIQHDLTEHHYGT